jgi:hypothetical protein
MRQEPQKKQEEEKWNELHPQNLPTPSVGSIFRRTWEVFETWAPFSLSSNLSL